MDPALRALLGGLTPQAFLRKYWQKEPLLVEAALPGFPAPLTRAELFALAARDDVQSRLVQRTGRHYTQRNGPFKRGQLERLPARNWTLLVQGVNLQDDAADALLRRFAFIPYARLDDLMVSDAGAMVASRTSGSSRMRRFASSRASRRSTKQRWHLATCCTCRPIMRMKVSRSTSA
jgi:ribosomal protein L16 Arg81 hydroxylase